MSTVISIIVLIIAAQTLFVTLLPKSTVFDTFFLYMCGIIFSACCFFGESLLYCTAGSLMLIAIAISFVKEYKKGTFY